MASTAVGSYSTNDVIQLLQDAAWTVHAGTVPATVRPPAITVKLAAPVQFAQGLADEDHGQLLDRWRIIFHGTSVDQVRQMRNEVVRRLGEGWAFEIGTDTELDDREQPNRYVAAVVFRSWGVVE